MSHRPRRFRSRRTPGMTWLLVVLLGLALAGCGSQAPAPKAPAPAPAPAAASAAAAAPAAAKPTAQAPAPAKPGKKPAELVFMTGSTGGIFQAMGAALADEIQKARPDVRVSVLPGNSGSNIVAIEEGKAHLGLSNSFLTTDAMAGKEPFKAKATNTVNLVSLHPQYFQLLVQADSKIKKIEDLKGRSLATLRKGSAGEVGVADLLSVYGLSYKDMSKVEFGAAGANVDLMKDRHVEALTWIAPMPAAYFIDLTTSRPIRFVPPSKEKVEELQKRNPGYVPDRIPKGTYKNLDQDLLTFGTYAHLVVAADLDEQLIYDLTRVMVNSAKKLQAMSAELADITEKAMAREVGVPFHPAAVRYLKEKGLK